MPSTELSCIAQAASFFCLLVILSQEHFLTDFCPFHLKKNLDSGCSEQSSTGDDDGEAVGDDDADAVGGAVGEDVGDDDGAAVGEDDVDAVGDDDGAAVDGALGGVPVPGAI